MIRPAEPAHDWGSVRDGIEAGGAHLLEELRAAAARLFALAERQEQRLVEYAGFPPPGPTLSEIAAAFHDHAPVLLVEPLDACREQRPMQTMLDAFDEYDRFLGQVARSLPDRSSGSGQEWIDRLGPGTLGPLTQLRLRFTRGITIDLREAMTLGLDAHRRGRRPLEGALAAAVGELMLDLLVPWHTVRRAWLTALSGDTPPGGIAGAAERMGARRRQHQQAIERSLAAVERWLARLPGAVARRAPFRAPRRAGHFEAPNRADDPRREFLQRQGRAVEADLDLDVQLAWVDTGLIDAAQDMRTAIEREHGALLEELAGVLAWLERWQPGNDSPFPSPAADVEPAATRLRRFEHLAHGLIDTLPQVVEVTVRLAARPGLRHTWTVQRPLQVVRDSFATTAVPHIGDGLASVERQHQAIVLEIERAREVVTFARETVEAAAGNDARIEQEGVANARSLLQFHQQHIHAVPADLDAAVVGGLLGAAERTYRLLDEGQFGVLRHAARDGLPRAIRLLTRRSAGWSQTALGWLLARLVRGYRAALVGIGWMPAPPVAGTHVVVARGYLTGTLRAEARPDRLPMIYRRLFRLAPVEDPRFLIGRQQELQAIADARRLWEAGRDAGILLVGARGSGKTSLINCAQQRLFAGLEVVRSEFVERLTRREELYAFLGTVLHVRPEDVERQLTSTRRVIVLEELERTFLRRPSGFEAIRALLGLVSRTSRHNLWLVSVNYSGFRLLNASLRLEPHFSHQINAMAVEQPDLRDAIMMRHNLSGLRLRFAPSPDGDTYVQRLARATGMPADPETAFFDALYRESGGVFRTAFALWQRYIDRAEGGILYMKPPSRPEYEAIVRSLDILDLFTLTALLQHGSLTPREHAVLFQIDDTKSRAWLDNLLARELIEPDPGRYGYRVVPDAAEVVRQTLFRRNLG